MGERRFRVRGFTLVELLAVIAIIMLLLSILIPTLRKSRELARRAICASNLKALATMLTTYASTNTGRIPLGYIGNRTLLDHWRQGNYMVNVRSEHFSHPDMFFGCLVNEGLVPNPRLFFCPSCQMPLFQFDTDENPWLRFTASGDYNWTRTGYGTRPLAGWYSGTSWVSFGWPDPKVLDLPRYEALEGRTAIASDIVSTRDLVATHHDEGVNYATSGGSVHWFVVKRFNNLWQKTAGTTFYPGEYAQGFFDESPPPSGVWFDMDRGLGG